jgi:hypothetical protein
VKSFFSFASIAINLLSTGTRKTEAESRDIAQFLSKLKILPNEEYRNIYFYLQVFLIFPCSEALKER